MNELQKSVLDLFVCFVETCEKLELNYFLACGSALGAVRHGGFIPWDDDFDVAMYREDYNKFMESAVAVLPDGIFLQNYQSDPAFPKPYAKLRNSNTTYVEKRMAALDINHGIYIDIFPLDGYPESRKEQGKLAAMKKHYNRRLMCALSYYEPLSVKTKIAILMRRFCGYHKRTAQTLESYEAYVSQYPVEGSKIICCHGAPYGERAYMPAEYYGRGTEVLFEGIKVRVPEKYDEYLTSLYGDWRILPPKEKQVGHHYYLICDLENPYTNYEWEKKK